MTPMVSMGTPGKRGPKPGAAPAFLARREAIAVDLDRGHKMRAVYQTYASQLGVSYSQFTRYVNQHIRKKLAKPKGDRHAPSTAMGSSKPPPFVAAPHRADRGGSGPIVTPSLERRRFIHDPAAIHTKKLF